MIDFAIASPRRFATLCLLLLPAFLPSTGVQIVSAHAAAPAWKSLTATGPTARWDHTLAADPATGTLILFGGRDADGAPSADTWLYAAAEDTWTALAGPAPSARFGHAVAVDGANRTMYLFAGQADGDTFFNDTWRLDLDTQRWEKLATADPAPSPRYGTSAVLDDDGNLLISHGFTFEGRFDDTWSFDPATATWTDLSPAPPARPLKRCLHEAVWNSDMHRMLLYGGCSSGFGPCPQGDLWAFDPATRIWTELKPATGPAARANPALIHDDRSGGTWLIDGLTEAGYVADLWTLDLGGTTPTWSKSAPGGTVPEPRASHDAALLDGDVWLFGGNGNTGALADLWVLESVGEE